MCVCFGFVMVYAKAIYKDPESYFTPELLEKLDAIAQQHFAYGEN